MPARRRWRPLPICGRRACESSKITLNRSLNILNIRGSLNHWVGDFKPYVPFDSLGFGFPEALVSQLPRPTAFPSIAIDGATTMGQSSGNSDYEGSASGMPARNSERKGKN